LSLIPSHKPWFGRFNFDGAQTNQWRIGALTVSVQRHASEWQVCHLNTGAAIDEQVAIEVTENTGQLEAGGKCQRHAVALSNQPLQVLPALADRPVVTRPLIPFHLHSGQETLLYVGTSIWLQIYAFETGPLLLDLPVQRPSDTWFGPSTREGELCYAARTRAISNLQDLPSRTIRATTPVRIKNNGQTSLLLERLLLPIPQLSVFATYDNRLWTEELSIHCDQEMRSAHLRIGKGAPAIAGTTEQLSPPRVLAERNVLTRALGTIFG
jgi:hypothetical protein